MKAEADISYGTLNSNSLTQFNTVLNRTPVSADIFTEDFRRDISATSIEEMLNGYGAGGGANSGQRKARHRSHTFRKGRSENRGTIRESALNLPCWTEIISDATAMSPVEAELHRRFLRLFMANEESVRALVRRLVPTRTDADDVMQEVSIVLWEKFGSFREGAEFRAWAFGVARFEVLAWLRDKGRDRLVLDETAAARLAQDAEAIEPALSRQRAALEHCMAKVPPDQRSLLLRAYEPNARIQEVAAGSGRTVAGFYQWLHRMRRALLDCIHATLAREESR